MFVIDTSSLIELKNRYRRTTFPTVWERIEAQITAGALVAPHEVRREIEKGDDMLVEWVKTVDETFFVDLTDEQGAVVAEIHDQFPKFIGLLKPGIDADPLCVALAVVNSKSTGSQWTVVNEERASHPDKIPAVCRALGVGSIKLLDLFDDLGGF